MKLEYVPVSAGFSGERHGNSTRSARPEQMDEFCRTVTACRPRAPGDDQNEVVLFAGWGRLTYSSRSARIASTL